MPWPVWSGSMAGNLSSWLSRPRRWRHRRCRVSAVAFFTALAMFAAAPARADEFYGRTLARYLGRHIPGNPQVLPQNMPGAGSLKSVNYLYNVAPKDGTAIGIFAPGIIAEPLLGHGDGAQFDATKFGWLGSVSQEVSVC